MDFENNGQSATNFMHKIKKQAKRLFQLSKTTNNNLEINSLSKAQELLAQINGYPDWHALEKHISNSKTILQKENENKITLSKFDFDNIFYLKTDSTITTFYRVSSIDGKKNEIEDKITYFLDMFSFQLNMNLHEVSLFVEQKNNKYEKECSYNLYNISKSFNLTEDEAKKMFFIDKSQTKSFENNELTIYIMLTSSNKNEAEHLDLCLSMKKLFPELESLNTLNEQQFTKFEFKEGIINEKITQKLFNKENNISKYIYLINFLNNKKVDYLCKYSLKNKEFRYKFNNINEELMNGLINGILNTSNYPEQELNYKSKPSLNYVTNNETKGLSFVSTINKNIFNYNHMSNSRTSHVDLIYGKPGSGKSVLTNMINLSLILDKDLKNIPKIGIIDIGPSSKGLLKMVQNILPNEMNHTVKYIKYGKLESKDGLIINPLDLPLGQKKYESEDIARIAQVIAGLFNDTPGLIGFIQAKIEKLNYLESKKYEKSINKEIDKKLMELNFDVSSKTTWHDVVDFLFINKEISLAKKAQLLASYVISDLILNDNKIEDIYKNLIVSTGENIIQYFNRVIVTAINYFPKITQQSNIIINDEKIVTIDLDDVYFFSSQEKVLNINSYIFMTVADYLKQNLLDYNKFANFNFPSYWKDDWTTYLNKEPLQNIYSYYHYQKYKENNFNMSKLMIDEYHRYSSNINVESFILDTIRNSRKNNIAISICSQSLDDLKNIKDFASGLFISQIVSSDSQKLLNFGFTANEINLMKEMKFPNWALKLSTNRGNVFDIVKLEMTNHLQLAFSSLSEDIFVKDLLLKKYDFTTMLNKSIEFLSSQKSRYGFKLIIEKMKEDGFTDEYIKKYLLENI